MKKPTGALQRDEHPAAREHTFLSLARRATARVSMEEPLTRVEPVAMSPKRPVITELAENPKKLPAVRLCGLGAGGCCLREAKIKDLAFFL